MQRRNEILGLFRLLAMMRRIETVLVILAIAFYAWFLHRLGVASVLSYVRMVGWGLGVTIALESVSRVFNALGWRVTVAEVPRELSFVRMFQARIAGEAVDYVTPSAQLGGQFVTALMVRRRLKMAIGLATVIVAALAEALGQIGFISIAMLLSMRFAARFHELLWPIIGGMTLAIGLAGAFFAVQLRSPFSWLWNAAAKLDLPQLANPEIKDAAADADAILSEFYLQHRGRFAASCLCYLVSWSMGPIEIYILLRLLHQPAEFHTVLLIEALGQLVEKATFMIPGKLVSQEGGKALILSLLGYPAEIGFVIGFLRRIKEMVWVLFGIAALLEHRFIEERGKSVTQSEAESASYRFDRAVARGK
ncbi:MAG TPA: lysylphosphatidylglycerol synthase domain-containing protein [Candidatus Binataceae bacterium]